MINRKTKVADAINSRAQQEKAQASSMFATMFAMATAGPRRNIVATVSAFTVAAFGIYGGMQMAAYLTIGALMLTGSAFMAFVLSFVVLCFTIITSVQLGGKVYSWVITGTVDRTFAAAKNKVTSFFAPKIIAVMPTAGRRA
jgi:hypothetical protein